MIQRLRHLVSFYLTALLFFIVAKPLFMLFNRGAGHAFTAGDVADVVLHGLVLDAATAGYLIIVPWLFMLVSVWLRIPALHRTLCVWYALTALLATLICVADTCLYSFWDFKLDATIFTYLDSPRNAVASVSPGYLFTALTAIATVSLGVFCLWRALTPRTFAPIATLPQKAVTTGLLLVAGGLIFLGIRGGTGKSTANTGMVYYSSNQFLNHAAVNPAFNLFYSLGKTEDFGENCNYYPEETRSRLFAALDYDTLSHTTDTLLRTPRPNVLIVLMEGFGASFVGRLDGVADVTPRFDSLCGEGILFTQCYGNSYRTDRGTVCALSGYPAFPNVSVMKLPQKSRTLPSIARSLSRAGYATDFVYGGDINFTNMQSYLRATGYRELTGDTHFDAQARSTHAWGVTDSIMFDFLFEQLLKRTATDRPWHTTFLTLASHEPWTVPYNRIRGDEKANAMAYLDDCLGRFVDKLKNTPLWDNLLLICLPDHAIAYPEGLTTADKRRFHIPMLWLGGALARQGTIDTLCNQTDLPATLLGQMGLPHGDFRFSRDVTASTYRYPSAQFAFGGGFGWIDSTGCTVTDLATDRATREEPAPSAHRDSLGRAFMQTIFDDLDER